MRMSVHVLPGRFKPVAVRVARLVMRNQEFAHKLVVARVVVMAEPALQAFLHKVQSLNIPGVSSYESCAIGCALTAAMNCSVPERPTVKLSPGLGLLKQILLPLELLPSWQGYSSMIERNMALPDGLFLVKATQTSAISVMVDG